MKIAMFTAAILSSGIAASATPIDGWYGAAFGGVTAMPDNLSVTRFGYVRNHARYDAGFNAGGQLGFKSNPLRYELEGTYIEASLRHFQLNSIRQRHRYVHGQTWAGLGMANVYYDFPDMVPTIQPFVGVGLGYAYVHTLIEKRTPYFRNAYSAEDSAFAYQVTGGFIYNFAENYALTLAYRYVGTTRVDALGKVFQANLGTAGVVYRFNEANYK